MNTDIAETTATYFQYLCTVYFVTGHNTIIV